jgi:ABC-2 type transport system ATP-binding protein
MIINRGKSVIVRTPDELRDRIAGQPTLQVTLAKLDQKVIEVVKELDFVRVVNVDESTSRLIITLDDVQSTTPDVVRSIVYAGGMILSVNVLRPSLEEAYLRLVRGK